MNKKCIIKRIITYTLLIISIIGILQVFGCRSEGVISEKQVIEATYNYLINKAEQLQGLDAKLKENQITWQFESAIINAMRDVYLSEDIDNIKFGKSVELQFQTSPLSGQDTSKKISTDTTVLERLAKSKDNNLWELSISGLDFEYDERTGEVRARNNEAAKLLEEITLRTYHNTKYGYSIKYPPDWNILDVIKEAVNISFVSSDGTMEAAIFLFCLPEIPGLGLNDYVEKRVNSNTYDSYEIYIAEGNPTIGGIVADIVGLRFDNLEKLGNYIGYEAKWYFIDKDEIVYEILTVARPTTFANTTNLFDPYKSFQFQP